MYITFHFFLRLLASCARKLSQAIIIVFIRRRFYLNPWDRANLNIMLFKLLESIFLADSPIPSSSSFDPKADALLTF